MILEAIFGVVLVIVKATNTIGLNFHSKTNYILTRLNVTSAILIEMIHTLEN